MADPSIGPIFIVGASRSGTAMARSILNNHSAVFLAGETHYFEDLRVRMAGRESQKLTDAEQRLCEDYFLALAHRPYGHGGNPAQSSLDRDELRQAAEACGSGSDALFQAFCEILAGQVGKRVWGEKTPRHVFRIREILSKYPDAKVICMVRDPRAVIASYRDWRNQGGFDLEKDPTHEQALVEEERRAKRSYNILIMSLLWRATVRAAVESRDHFGDERVRIQQYEDVVRSPAEAVEQLSAWLGLSLEPGMLQVPILNSSFSKFQEGAGISSEPLKRWRQTLSHREVGVVEAICGRAMERAGYDLEKIPTPRVYLTWLWVSLPFFATRAAIANRTRLGNLPRYIWRRARLMTGSARLVVEGQ